MGVGDINAVGEGAEINWSDEVEELDVVVPSMGGKCPGWDDPHYWDRVEVNQVAKEGNQVAKERKVVKVRKVVIKKEKTYSHLMPICTYLAMKLGQEGYQKLLTEERARNEEQLEEKIMARIQREPGVCQNPDRETFNAKDFDVAKLGEEDLKRLIRGWESGLEIVKVENGGKARHFVVILSLGPNYFNSRQPMVKKEETKEDTGESQLRGVEQEVIFIAIEYIHRIFSGAWRARVWTPSPTTEGEGSRQDEEEVQEVEGKCREGQGCETVSKTGEAEEER